MYSIVNILYHLILSYFNKWKAIVLLMFVKLSFQIYYYIIYYKIFILYS